MPHDLTDGELAGYIKRRLADMGDWAEEPGFIAESIAHYRDLWAMLFSVDHDLDSVDPDDPRFANPSS